MESPVDVLLDLPAHVCRKPLAELPQFLVLVEGLAGSLGGQGQDLGRRPAAKQMGEQIEREGGIGVRDFEHLEPVIGRDARVARVRFAQRLGHLFRGCARASKALHS